jgi:hypothetical protein
MATSQCFHPICMPLWPSKHFPDERNKRSSRRAQHGGGGGGRESSPRLAIVGQSAWLFLLLGPVAAAAAAAAAAGARWLQMVRQHETLPTPNVHHRDARARVRSLDAATKQKKNSYGARRRFVCSHHESKPRPCNVMKCMAVEAVPDRLDIGVSTGSQRGRSATRRVSQTTKPIDGQPAGLPGPGDLGP